MSELLLDLADDGVAALSEYGDVADCPPDIGGWSAWYGDRSTQDDALFEAGFVFRGQELRKHRDMIDDQLEGETLLDGVETRIASIETHVAGLRMLDPNLGVNESAAKLVGDLTAAQWKAKDLQKSLKGHVDFVVEQWNEYREEMRRRQEESLPLFDQVESGDDGEEVSEAWRDRPLSDLVLHGSKASVITKLVDQLDDATIGCLVNWQQYKRLVDFDGIGEAAAKEIEDALVTFWKSQGMPTVDVSDELE